MAKDNLFLGYARGKVGDVVFSRLNGVQVSRARNRAPRNPRSALQIAQRTIMKTNSLAYSYLQDIANHSFEGYAEGMECQRRFTKLNVSQMRAQVADCLTSGSDRDIYECEEYNFASKLDSLPVLRPYIISEGSLPSLSASLGETLSPKKAFVGLVTSPIIVSESRFATYAEVAQMIGAERGDQVTVCVLRWSGGSLLDAPSFNQMVTCRVILEPSDGDMSHDFYPASGESYANPRDLVPEGWTISAYVGEIAQDSVVTFMTNSRLFNDEFIEGSVAAHAVILSRRSGDMWLRSSETFHVLDTVLLTSAQFGYACRTWRDATTSNLYLNQSEQY